MMFIYLFIYLFLKEFIFRKRGKEGETEGEKHQCVVAPCMTSTGDLAHNPGMFPDWELNHQPFGLQDCTQSTEPHQPGQTIFIKWLYVPGIIGDHDKQTVDCLHRSYNSAEMAHT